MSPRVCVELWGSDPRTLIRIARTVEAVGLDGVYLGESPTGVNADPWTTLGAIAEATARIRLGPVIANLLPDYRSPVVLARHGATMAALSDGRFDFRTGVGATRRAGLEWWGPAGVNYPDYATRIAEAERQLTMLRTLWRGAAVTVGSVPFELGLHHPPIEVTLAASGRRALALAERVADRWETSFATVEEFAERARRAPSGLSTSLEVDVFVGTDADPDLVWRTVARDRSTEDLDALRARALVGSPATVADQIAELRAAGVHQLVATPHDPRDLDGITRLADAVDLLG